MPLSLSTYLLWGAGTALELLLCALALRNGLFRRLRFFTLYVLLVAIYEVTWFGAIHALGYKSKGAFYFFWLAQAILLFARAVAIAELCQHILGPYRGVWALAKSILLGIALILLGYATIATLGRTSWITAFILTAGRGLELAAAVILLTLLFISAYYRIRLEPVVRLVALGLCFFSTVQMLNNSFLVEWLVQYFRLMRFFPLWDGIRTASFNVAVVIWCLAVWRPLSATAPGAILLPQQVYDELAPQVNYRLRMLNQRLLEMLKI